MESTNIYFIGSLESGTVKIGKSNNPEKRLVELQTANPHKLVLYGVIDDVTSELESRLHRILDPFRLEGEWFKLTDEVIRFMISKTDKLSYDFKINGSKLKPDPLEIAIDNIVKPNYGRGWVSEDRLRWVIRRFLVKNDESPHFDDKKLRQKLKHRGITGTKVGGEWIYPDHRADEKAIQPDHYIGPTSDLSKDTVKSWNLYRMLELDTDSKKYRNIKFTQGYSHITSLKDGSSTISAETIRSLGIKQNIVIYKRGVYDASCLD